MPSRPGIRLPELTTDIDTMIRSAGQKAFERQPKGMRLFHPGSRSTSKKLPLDSEAEKVLPQSTNGSCGKDILPRHLILAILHDKDSRLARILKRFPVDEALR